MKQELSSPPQGSRITTYVRVQPTQPAVFSIAQAVVPAAVASPERWGRHDEPKALDLSAGYHGKIWPILDLPCLNRQWRCLLDKAYLRMAWSVGRSPSLRQSSTPRACPPA